MADDRASGRSDSAAADGLGHNKDANLRKDTLHSKLSISSQSSSRTPRRGDEGGSPQTLGVSAPEMATVEVATSRLPGRFEDLSPSSSHLADDPAALFILGKKQSPGVAEGKTRSPSLGSRQLASTGPAFAAAPATTLGPTAKKSLLFKRQLGRGVSQRGTVSPLFLGAHLVCSYHGIARPLRASFQNLVDKLLCAAAM